MYRDPNVAYQEVEGVSKKEKARLGKWIVKATFLGPQLGGKGISKSIFSEYTHLWNVIKDFDRRQFYLWRMETYWSGVYICHLPEHAV